MPALALCRRGLKEVQLLFSCGPNVGQSSLAPKRAPSLFTSNMFFNASFADEEPPSFSEDAKAQAAGAALVAPAVMSLVELRGVVATGRSVRGLNRTALETHLSEEDFYSAMGGLAQKEFAVLPRWRQRALKKNAGLF